MTASSTKAAAAALLAIAGGFARISVNSEARTRGPRDPVAAKAALDAAQRKRERRAARNRGLA